MRIMQKFRVFMASVIAGTMLFQAASIMPVQEADAASVCTIDTNKTYQIIKGFGGINLREWTGSDLTSEQVQKAFGNGDDELGLSILRIYVNDNSSQWNLAVPVAKQAQALGATVFASPWNPPESMRVSGGSNGKYMVDKSKYADYAKHLNDFVKYMEGQGVDLYSVSVQNEPDYAHDWTYWSASDCASFIADYGKAVTAGTNAKLMSPESFQYRKDIYNAILNNSKAFENCDLFGTHFYGTQRSQMDFPALENCGKDIWMTEVYVPDSTSDADTYPQAVQVAENIHNGLTVGNMNAYVWWYIRRSYSPMKENGNISKRGYCMAQYSKWVRPGDVRIEATEQPDSNILVSAYKHSPTQIQIVAVNKGSSDVSQQFSVDGRTITGVDRYRTSATENIAPTKNMDYDTSTFWAQLPANSVSTFVVSLQSDGIEVPKDPNQPTADEPDENGYYFHDTFEGNTNNWTGRGSAEIQTSGRVPYAGSEALLVQNREKTWHGAQKTLNGKTFEAGKEYSFSACVNYLDGNATENFLLSLQYTDANGDTKYDHIASASAIKGSYVQLANTNYKIPEGASNPVIYVETESGTGNFYIDEAIGAVAGTIIQGPEEVKLILGDIDCSGQIDCLDMILARKGMKSGLSGNIAALAADVDQSGEFDETDLKLIQDFILNRITEFPVAERKIDFAELEQKFGSVSLAKSYKAENEHNPLMSQSFGADPGVMEYNGRVYVYLTADNIEYDSNGNIKENSYDSCTIHCISSADLVNWTDHGEIPAARSTGAAKWANYSWAPTPCHKTINGKEKFFLYFANNANGIGVLTADSPTGPWTDPIGKALVTRSTKNCSDVVWCFDPSVLVDDDGTGYLYFGGGCPTVNNVTERANPKTMRVVKLGDDMISLAGDPQVIDAPYLFEDTGINKINGKYYFSYCSNWSAGSSNLGMSACGIEYMVSDNPMGPFTYKGEAFQNIGVFFGTAGNNHHTILNFKNNYYLFYHSQVLNDAMGLNSGYRSAHVDKMTLNADGTFSKVKGTKTGVEQLDYLDPFSTVEAETFSHEGGIKVTGNGNTTVNADKGDWFRVSGVDCKNAQSITVKASSASGSIIKVCTGSASGTAVSYIEVPSGGSMQEITVPVMNLSGKNDLYFVFNNTTSIDNWKLN